MGFGYGPKMSQYRVPPAALPQGPSKAHVRALGPAGTLCSGALGAWQLRRQAPQVGQDHVAHHLGAGGRLLEQPAVLHVPAAQAIEDVG
jgi:hypothetical protein